MKQTLLILVFYILCITVSAQTKIDTSKSNPILIGGSYYSMGIDDYGTLVKVKNDSSHYWFTQYIRLKNRGIKDSVNVFYKKLMNKK